MKNKPDWNKLSNATIHSVWNYGVQPQPHWLREGFILNTVCHIIITRSIRYKRLYKWLLNELNALDNHIIIFLNTNSWCLCIVSVWSGIAASGRDSLDNDTETGSMVSQRREKAKPRRKHTNDHGQNDVFCLVLLFFSYCMYLTTRQCHLSGGLN